MQFGIHFDGFTAENLFDQGIEELKSMPAGENDNEGQKNVFVHEFVLPFEHFKKEHRIQNGTDEKSEQDNEIVSHGHLTRWMV